MTQTYEANVAIVGAGLTGLMAARVLKDADKEVLLVDKEKSVGGRLATRQIGAGSADCGAQFFTVRTPEFGEYVARWLASGLVFEWSRGWADGSLLTTRDGHPRYAVRGGMNQLAAHLDDGFRILSDVRVTAVRSRSSGWQLDLGNGAQVHASAVILTPPVPQSLELLSAGGVGLDASDQAVLTTITYEMCLTVMLAVDRPLHLPSPGGIQRPDANIHWIADNRAKGISHGTTVVTMQATGAYSRQLWDQPDERIISAFRVDILPLLGDAQVVDAQLQRWRYSRPVTIYPERYLIAKGHKGLTFAGDAFGGPRVEGAVLSGLAVGQAVLARL